jgi:hypothetical protein
MPARPIHEQLIDWHVATYRQDLMVLAFETPFPRVCQAEFVNHTLPHERNLREKNGLYRVYISYARLQVNVFLYHAGAAAQLASYRICTTKQCPRDLNWRFSSKYIEISIVIFEYECIDQVPALKCIHAFPTGG